MSFKRLNPVRPLEHAPSGESGITRALPRVALRAEQAATPSPSRTDRLWESGAPPAELDLVDEVTALQQRVNALSTELERKRAELEAMQALLPSPSQTARRVTRLHADPSPARREADAGASGAALCWTALSIQAEDGGCKRGERRSQLTLEVEFLDESALYSGLTEDISTGGVFVATYDALPVGTEVTLHLALSSGSSLTVRGQVRWLRGSGKGAVRPGMGIAFVELSGAAQATLRELCEHRAPLYFEL